MKEPNPTRRRRASAMTPEQRTETILEAAREVFLAKGFAAARVEDVSARAGIAKGTIYLHFDSKEALFKALIASLVTPPLGHMELLLQDDGPPSAELLRRAVEIIRSEILQTERRFVLRLLMTEGHNFPDIAAFYHDAVVARAMRLLRGIVERGVARGEFASDTLARFPQLFAAPMLLAVMWEGLFGARDPLDVDGLLQAHLDLVLRGIEARP
jgi:AcrR family transcriptional regulator